MFKSLHYKKENEWRMITYPVKSHPSKPSDNYYTRSMNNAIVPYSKWKLNNSLEKNAELFKSLLIGSCNKSEKHEIDYFAVKYNSKWRIGTTQNSKINYLGK